MVSFEFYWEFCFCFLRLCVGVVLGSSWLIRYLDVREVSFFERGGIYILEMFKYFYFGFFYSSFVDSVVVFLVLEIF